ncbi:N-acetylmuramoyl-L-alanine amidase [Enterococcus pseudoavium]|uniref:N-acetylmuramoyl-L-alanine amidase n=1 Tax=Enterococcus pseudoavium TaxID=44007 RepID=A0AAE4KXC4_9ENTE|nr:N-acetylmuramoyl-L-alanine amidase [Enterococcus pseudoavium]MDT2737675.1 N-acetylmuramoyl-L-alanine amidase [Enterococcus pseudoavium]
MKKKVLVAGLLTALFLSPIHSFAYEVNNEFNLGTNEGSSIRANPNYIVAHDTANASATGRNEATYMKRNWMNAYTSYIVGDGIVYQVGEPGYVQYGAGSYANANSPVQIELQATRNAALFKQNYKVYIDLIRDSAKRFGIPLTVDNPIGGKGVISHQYVSTNWWGDHTDPYGYLASMGVSQAQFANDVKNGFDSNEGKPVPGPTDPVDPTTAGSGYSVMYQPTANYAHVDQWGRIGNTLKARGWHVANYKYQYVFIIDRTTGKELARQKAPGVARPDVNSAYQTTGNVGYDVNFNAKQFSGKSVIVMTRATNDAKGNVNGGHQDFYETRWYHDIK